MTTEPNPLQDTKLNDENHEVVKRSGKNLRVDLKS